MSNRPAILNQMIRLDLRDPADNRQGYFGADLLDRARGSDSGRGFDWRLARNSQTGETKPKDLYFNARLTVLLHESWAKVLEDPEHWQKFDRTDM